MNKRNKRAFSLIETMVAVAILAIMSSVAASVASSSSRAAMLAKEKIMATYLAEEAGEVVKNFWQEALNRGDKVINSDSMLNGCMSNCFVDAIGQAKPTIQSCATDDCGDLYKTSEGFKSAGSSEEKSMYKRTVKIHQVGDDGSEGKRYKAEVTVSWNRSNELSFDYYLFPTGIYISPPVSEPSPDEPPAE